MRHCICMLLLLICSAAFTQTIVIDGTMDDAQWGPALATSAGGPTPGFGAGHVVNAVFVDEDATHLYFGIAGNVQDGNRILMFLDTQTGGYNTANFGRAYAPEGIDEFNSGTIFDPFFNPDYCLAIGTNFDHDNFFWDLYTLSGSVGSGGGPKDYLGDISSSDLAANPHNTDTLKGSEFKILKSKLGLTDTLSEPTTFQLFICYISDGGYLSNQFLSRAKSGEFDYGSGPVNFKDAHPSAILVDQGYILPIELSIFEAELVEGAVELHWQTESELNNDFFEIQHSLSGNDWEVIATVDGAGNSTAALQYTYTDVHPEPGMHYYRLKQVDYNGTFTYSDVVPVVVQTAQAGWIFPNPAGDYLEMPPGTELVRVFNVSGKIVLQQSGPGYLDIANLPAGTYFARMMSGSTVSTSIFVKQ